jgi:hypothetical protein
VTRRAPADLLVAEHDEVRHESVTAKDCGDRRGTGSGCQVRDPTREPPVRKEVGLDEDHVRAGRPHVLNSRRQVGSSRLRVPESDPRPPLGAQQRSGLISVGQPCRPVSPPRREPPHHPNSPAALCSRAVMARARRRSGPSGGHVDRRCRQRGGSRHVDRDVIAARAQKRHVDRRTSPPGHDLARPGSDRLHPRSDDLDSGQSSPDVVEQSGDHLRAGGVAGPVSERRSASLMSQTAQPGGSHA